jgi:hypothetical protein
MGSSIPASEATTPVRTAPPALRKKKPRLKKRGRQRRPAVRYGALAVAMALVALFIQFAIHTYRTEPRDSRVIAERELQLNTLAPGERVIRMVSVFQRPWLDYFRATRGLLVVTNRRALFLGLQPRDLLASGESPPTFEERDFPIDTLVTFRPGRTFFGIAKAIIVETPDGTFDFGVPSESWGKANLLLHSIEARHQRLYAEAARQKEQRDALEAKLRVAAEEARRAKYYVVRRGDAISSIATRWNTTADRLREWNHLPDNKIRVGQSLLVKPELTESALAGEVKLPPKK